MTPPTKFLGGLFSMNTELNASDNLTIWVKPIGEPELLKNRAREDIEKWHELVARVIAFAKPQNLTKAEISRRANMPDTTFHQWFSGNYNGNLNRLNLKIEQWLDQANEVAGLAIPKKPAFQMTRIAREIIDTLAMAQATSDLVMITLGAGNGKTEACRHYAKTRPNVYLVTASPHTRTTHGMLMDLRDAIGVMEHNPARMTRAIGERLQRIGDGTLLIVDEAQNLTDDAINQLRHFVDNYGTGLALIGNDEVYGRLARRSDGPSYAQIKSRLGRRLNRTKPYDEDIAARISAWEITEEKAVKFLTGIGFKAGALRQIDKTLLLASYLAAGANEPVEYKHIKAAWTSRDIEDFTHGK